MSSAVHALEAQLKDVVANKDLAIEARDRHKANAETQQITVDIYASEEAELLQAINAVKADRVARP